MPEVSSGLSNLNSGQGTLGIALGGAGAAIVLLAIFVLYFKCYRKGKDFKGKGVPTRQASIDFADVSIHSVSAKSAADEDPDDGADGPDGPKASVPTSELPVVQPTPSELPAVQPMPTELAAEQPTPVLPTPSPLPPPRATRPSTSGTTTPSGVALPGLPESPPALVNSLSSESLRMMTPKVVGADTVVERVRSESPRSENEEMEAELDLVKQLAKQRSEVISGVARTPESRESVTRTLDRIRDLRV